MKSLLILLLVASSPGVHSSALDNLDSIPLVEGTAAQVSLDPSLEEQAYIDNSSNKTVTLKLTRQRTHKEVMQSHIFKKQMKKVMAGKSDSSAQTESAEEGNSIGVSLHEEHGMYYSTNVYLGSEKQELTVAFST
jgi:hypothetical protein